MAYKSSPAKLSVIARQLSKIVEKLKDGPGVPPPSKRKKKEEKLKPKVTPKRVKKTSVAKMKASPAKISVIAKAVGKTGVGKKIVKAAKKRMTKKKKQLKSSPIKQKLSPKASAAKAKRDKAAAMSEWGKYKKRTAQRANCPKGYDFDHDTGKCIKASTNRAKNSK